MSFNFVKQPNESYCGPACLKMIANFYKVTLSIESLRRKFFNTKESGSYLDLSEVADSLGFRSLGVKVPYEILYDNVPFPCIVYWRQKHFVIVYKIKKDKIWIADPSVGLETYSRELFIKNWAYSIVDNKPAGLVLIIEPTPSLFQNDHSDVEQVYNSTENSEKIANTVVSINDEIKRYLALHPEKIYNLDSRKFEELIADILHDLGFKVELTQATRDGGKDIYAYVRTAVCNFLIFVECKKWATNHHVGIDVVQRLYGVQQSGQANKSMIITTSFFTLPAIKEAKRYNGLMDLHDFNSLKEWLRKYQI